MGVEAFPAPVRRKLTEAARASHDLIIIGGGVYGVAVTLEATRRGLKPLLIERDDFGQHTSFNSLRIVHGGLRYLQNLDLLRFRESVGERRWFLKHFPDLVRPLDCLMPLYGKGLRRPQVFRAALWLDHLLAFDRNRGVDRERHIRRGRVISADEARLQVPDLNEPGMQGAARWQDGAMASSELLLFEMLRWAVAGGAQAINHMTVTGVEADGDRVTGVAARDSLNGSQHVFRAPLVINCAGPQVRSILAGLAGDGEHLFRPSLGFNLLLDRPAPWDVAVTVEPARDGAGTLFLHPWYGRILVGTVHCPWTTGTSGPPVVSEADVTATLGDVAQRFPSLKLDRDAVLEVRAGFLPATEPGGCVQAKKPVIVDHGQPARSGRTLSGLFSVSGVKWTTARHVAARLFSSLQRKKRIEAPTPIELPRPKALLTIGARAFLALSGDEARRWTTLFREETSALTPQDVIRRRTEWQSEPELAHDLEQRLTREWPGESKNQDLKAGTG
ncbi:MAG: FAD-dependent oxidoreductase [Geminicoccaceae bacterium]